MYRILLISIQAEAPENVLTLLDSQTNGSKPVDETMHNSSSVSKELQARQLILLRELISEKLAGLGDISCS